MRRMMMTGALMAGLAACGAGEETTAAPEVQGPAPAETWKAGAETVRATPDSGEAARVEAAAFVRDLYRRMEDESFAPLAESMDQTVFTAEVVRLLDGARSWTDEGVHPALEADPVCLCQDPVGMTLRDVTVLTASGDRATARVRFDFGKEGDAESARAPLLVLKREADGWRVDDIRTDDGFSFRRELAE